MNISYMTDSNRTIPLLRDLTNNNMSESSIKRSEGTTEALRDMEDTIHNITDTINKMTGGEKYTEYDHVGEMLKKGRNQKKCEECDVMKYQLKTLKVLLRKLHKSYEKMKEKGRKLKEDVYAFKHICKKQKRLINDQKKNINVLNRKIRDLEEYESSEYSDDDTEYYTETEKNCSGMSTLSSGLFSTNHLATSRQPAVPHLLTIC